MSEFDGRVMGRVAESNLKEISVLLKDMDTIEWDVAEASGLVSRLKSVVMNVIGRLSLSEPYLISGQVLAELESPTQDILHAVQELKNSAPSVNLHLPSTHQWTDELLRIASALPTVPVPTTDEALTKTVSRFHSEVQLLLKTFNEDVERVSSRADEIRNRLDNASNEFHSLVSHHEASVHERTTHAASTTENLIVRATETSERLERDVTGIQEVFRESQNDRDEEFKQSQNIRNAEFQDRLNPTLEDVESYRDQARGMLEEVAGASTAEHYAKHREKQETAANLWRVIGVSALFLLVLAGGWIFFEARSEGQNLGVVWLVARSGVLGPILILSTYALRQSGQHRRREEDISRVTNELQLLWPFMNRLPEEDRQTLLKDITPLYFKGGLTAQDSTEKIGLTNRLRDVLPRQMGGHSN